MAVDYHFTVYGDDIELGILTNDEQAVEAFKRDHPDWVQFPVEINLPRAARSAAGKSGMRPRGTPGALRPALNRPLSPFETAIARPLTPEQIRAMLSVAEVLAARAAERRVAVDGAIIEAQFRRGGGGPTRTPGGGFGDMTPQQEMLAYRYEQAREEIARLEPNNPYRTIMRAPNTPPREDEVVYLENEAIAARARAAAGAPPRGSATATGKPSRMKFRDWDEPTPEQEAADAGTYGRTPEEPTFATLELAKPGEATLSNDRRTYILDGDGKGGGGHGPGRRTLGKSEFPSDWSDEQAAQAIRDVANDAASVRLPAAKGRTEVQGTRYGVDIKVIVGADGRTIVTAYPTNVPRHGR